MDKLPQWVQFLACSRVFLNHHADSERGKLGHKMYTCLMVYLYVSPQVILAKVLILQVRKLEFY